MRHGDVHVSARWTLEMPHPADGDCGIGGDPGQRAETLLLHMGSGAMKPDFVNTRQRMERSIVECWRDVLQLPTVDPHQNFFDLGGTSVLAIVLHRKLREQLPSHHFGLVTVFQHPTVASFVDALLPGSSGADAAPAAVARPAMGPGSAPGMSARERALHQHQTFADRAAAGRTPS